MYDARLRRALLCDDTVIFVFCSFFFCSEDMNQDCLKLCESLVPASYVQQGVQAKKSHEQKIRILLQHVRF